MACWQDSWPIRATRPPLKGLLKQAQPKPAKTPEYLDDAIDDAVAFLQAAGIHDYDWKPVLADMKTATWDYFGFDLPNSPYKNKSTATPVNEGEEGTDNEAPPLQRPRRPNHAPFEITLPAGMDNWFAPAFDAKKAGWKSGPGAIRHEDGGNGSGSQAWISKYPLYPPKRPMPNTVIGNDVVLMRGTFELPPLKEGHRYRIRLDGSIHDNSGEGYAIYLNGKLLTEVKNGVYAWRKQGLRGSHVWQEYLDDFKGGKVTIAVANFPMSNFDPEYFIPAIGPLERVGGRTETSAGHTMNTRSANANPPGHRAIDITSAQSTTRIPPRKRS